MALSSVSPSGLGRTTTRAPSSPSDRVRFSSFWQGQALTSGRTADGTAPTWRAPAPCWQVPCGQGSGIPPREGQPGQQRRAEAGCMRLQAMHAKAELQAGPMSMGSSACSGSLSGGGTLTRRSSSLKLPSTKHNDLKATHQNTNQNKRL